MRARYDENGKLIGYRRMVFDDIPDDYIILPIILEQYRDLSYMGVMKQLRDKRVSEEFDDDKYYSSQVLSHLAIDYLYSSIQLSKAVENDRGQEVITLYLVPAVFLCRHAIELKMKHCLIEKGIKKIDGHSIVSLWFKLNEEELPNYKEITAFLEEIERIDKGETSLRYGIGKDLSPIEHVQKYDLENMITNTKYLFNILDEFVISSIDILSLLKSEAAWIV